MCNKTFDSKGGRGAIGHLFQQVKAMALDLDLSLDFGLEYGLELEVV